MSDQPSGIRGATAAVLGATGESFAFESIELAAPQADEVIVELVGCGVCHSDASVQSGVTPFPMPAVLGHEGSGVVVETGAAVRSLQPGDHVVMQSASCGHCVSCLTGHPLHCDHWRDLNLGSGSRLDGTSTIETPGLHGHFFGQSSFSTSILANERTAVRVPKSAPLELLGPLGCGVQTGAQSVLSVLRPEPGSTLVIFGAGAVGLSALLAAVHLTGASVIAVDVTQSRLALATELGAAHVVDATAVDPVEAVMELTQGRGAAYTLESSGLPPVLANAIEVLAPMGTCGVVGAPALDATVPLPVIPLVARGATIVGINQGEVVAQESIPSLVSLFEAGRFPFDKLVEYYPFAELNSAVSSALSGEVVKPIVTF